MDRRKVYIGLSAGALAGLGIYLAIRNASSKKMIEKIHRILDAGEGATGTFKDLKASKAFDVNFWKKARKSKKVYTERVPLSTKRGATDAKGIYDALKGYDDEKKVYSILRKQKAQVEVSLIASVFNNHYKQSLYSYLDSNLSDSEMDTVAEIVTRLPLYK